MGVQGATMALDRIGGPQMRLDVAAFELVPPAPKMKSKRPVIRQPAASRCQGARCAARQAEIRVTAFSLIAA